MSILFQFRQTFGQRNIYYARIRFALL